MYGHRYSPIKGRPHGLMINKKVGLYACSLVNTLPMYSPSDLIVAWAAGLFLTLLKALSRRLLARSKSLDSFLTFSACLSALGSFWMYLLISLKISETLSRALSNSRMARSDCAALAAGSAILDSKSPTGSVGRDVSSPQPMKQAVSVEKTKIFVFTFHLLLVESQCVVQFLHAPSV